MLRPELFDDMADGMDAINFPKKARSFMFGISEQIDAAKQYDFVKQVASNTFIKTCYSHYERVVEVNLTVEKVIDIAEICCYTLIFPRIKKGETEEEIFKALREIDFQDRASDVAAAYCCQFILTDWGEE